MQPGDQPGPLAGLGLSAAEEAAYELLIDWSPTTAAELDAVWERDEPLADTLAALVSKGLIRTTATVTDGVPVRYAAVSPDLALGPLLARRERQARAAQAHIDQLTATYRGSSGGRPVLDVITGREAFERQLVSLYRSTRSELRCLVGPPADSLPSCHGAGHHGVDVTAMLDLRARRMRCRMVYSRDLPTAPTDPTVAAGISQLVEAGVECRTMSGLPTTLYIADDQSALLPLPEDDPYAWDHDSAAGPAALVLHPGTLVDALVALFEQLWVRAVPSPPDSHSEPDPAPPSNVDPDLIALLLSGSTDVAIARQLGVAHRTVTRRVAALMAELSAHTRFQAGVLAALRDRARNEG